MNKERTIEEVLKEDGVFVSTTAGMSMYPMLRNRRDTIIVKPYEGRLKKYDIPLYKRNGTYILHRIVKVLPDSYVICGDNCEQREYDISDKQILGVLTGFYRDSEEIDMQGWKYRLYARFWCFTFPIRIGYRKVRRLLGRIYKKIFRSERG
jgi:signal peptidase I